MVVADSEALGQDADFDLAGVQDDIVDFQSDVDVRKALDEGVSMKEYSARIQVQLRDAEDNAIRQFVKHGDRVADLHREIQTCDGILEGLERMLRGFQESLGGISSDIKKLQVESLSMNIKLRNRRAAERKLSQFIQTVVINPDLVRGICSDPIDAKFLDHLADLHAKILYLRHPDEHPSLVETGQHVRTLTDKAVSRIRQFLMQKINDLQKSRSNVQVKQAVLLKYRYLSEFLHEHAPNTANEVMAFYTTTMSALLSSFFQGYISEVHAIQAKRASKDLAAVDKTDVLCADAVKGGGGGLFGVGAKKSDQHLVNILSLGDRHTVLGSPSFSPGAMDDSGRALAWEDVFDSVLHLLLNTAISEHQYVDGFFNNPAMFGAIFAKTIGLIQADLEHYLSSSFDVIGILLSVRVCEKHRSALTNKPEASAIQALEQMFDRFRLLVWPRFKIVFDCHCASFGTFKIAANDAVCHSAHVITRRFASLCHAVVTLNSAPFNSDEIVTTSLSRLRNSFVSLLNQMAATLSQSDRIVFLINQLEHVSIELKSATGSEEAAAFSVLAEQHVTAYASNLLQSREEFKQMIAFINAANDSSLSKDASKQAYAALKTFASQWTYGIDAVFNVICSGQFSGNGADPRWQEAIVKRVSLELLTYYKQFDEIIRSQYTSLAGDLVPIQTVVYQVKKRHQST